MSFLPYFKSPEELAGHQLAGLKWTVNHAYSNNDFYREKFDAAGVSPASVKSLDDLRRLPFTQASDLKDGYPFPLLSVNMRDVVRVHASSGTTGKRKVMTYTQADIDDWARMFARCYELAGLTRDDRVQIAVGYGIWTAGVGFQLGCELFGATAVPVGPGFIDMHCQFLLDFEVTTLCCTSSMALLLSEELSRRGLLDKIKLKRLIYGSERTSNAMRERISKGLGGVSMHDIPGMTELYGPGMGIECSAHQGMHYWADYFILEILDPETLEPVKPGETGEMVVTTLSKEAAPLVRYRTRDLSRLLPEPCPCGCAMPRHGRILGRSDDMIIFRAVNIYPGQVDHVLSGCQGISSEYQIILDRGQDGKDYMTVKVERDPAGRPADDAGTAAAIQKRIKSQIMVSAKVELVDHASLPRSERKSQRVFDHRDQD